MPNINIGHKDVIWNYAAIFLLAGSGIILLPFILHAFPQETVAVWTIFSTVTAFSVLLDFGFNPSFARNVSYIVSGAKVLKKTGHCIVESNADSIDYGLFKGLIQAMRWFYSRVAFILFFILITAGTYYIHTILKTYSGDHTEVYISWIVLCMVNSYSLYTLYYDSILQGEGLIKRAKQIRIAGQLIYLITAIVLILWHFNLIAIVSAQVLSILTIRVLSYRTIYTAEFKSILQNVKEQSRKEILKQIYPNALKVGLTGLGAFLVTRSSIIIGSLYLSLGDIASYGITMQIIGILSAVAGVYFATYQPKLVQDRVFGNNSAIKQIYLKSCFFQFFTFIIGGLALLAFGDWALNLIGSQTPLLSQSFMAVILLVSFLESNHSIAGGILLTKNEVPFFKAALFSSAITIALLFVFFHYTDSVWGMILAPGIAQAIYQNWKWPMVVARELNIKPKDVCNEWHGMGTFFIKNK
jgi:O-antigen/teichoic acid export membrane protein